MLRLPGAREAWAFLTLEVPYDAAMAEQDEPSLLQAALSGDGGAFERLIAPYQRELFVHCYRILGSVEDAEDILQETWLRAWRRLTTFEARAPFRAWLYKIATNAALDARSSRRVRTIPTLRYSAADPSLSLSPPPTETIWIEPAPDVMLFASTMTPAALYEERESVFLAFLAVLQLLPGRQRAALLLRDVLGWSIPEVAQMLETSITAINSALQRARATMHGHGILHDGDRHAPADDDRINSLLSRYVRAWEAADAPALAALLREDAAFAMPPLAQWFRGRADIARFVAGALFGGDAAGRFRLVAARANGRPAFAVYQRDESGVYRASCLQLLAIEGNEISAIDSFLVVDPRLFARFNFGAQLD